MSDFNATIPAPGWTIENEWGRTWMPGFTPEKLAAYEAAIAAFRQAWDAHAKAARAHRDKVKTDVLNAAVQAGARATVSVDASTSRSTKRVTKKLEDAIGPFLPPVPELRWPHSQDLSQAEYFVQRTKDVLAKEAAANAVKAREAEASALVTEAVQWLLNKGKKIGDDFTVADAIAKADELAHTEWVAARVAKGGYIGFSGQNCEGPCEGWDMQSRRCQCGNRRVCWSGHGSFKNPGAYAEAY